MAAVEEWRKTKARLFGCFFTQLTKEICLGSTIWVIAIGMVVDDANQRYFVWEEQDGICPFTGWSMILPDNNHDGWVQGPNPRNASIDRIDNSKGYIQGNVRYICVMANYCRNGFSDEAVEDFCCAVAKKKGGTQIPPLTEIIGECKFEPRSQ